MILILTYILTQTFFQYSLLLWSVENNNLSMRFSTGYILLYPLNSTYKQTLGLPKHPSTMPYSPGKDR